MESAEGSYNLWDKLKSLPAYRGSYKLSKEIYVFCQTLKNNREFWFIMDQLVRAIDSVSANIAEGFGRFYYKDKIRFYYQARGFLLEVCDWLAKAKDRNFINEELVLNFKSMADNIFRDLEVMISNTKQQVKKLGN